MRKTWWKEAIIYQIFPKSFYDANGDGIGDLSGIIQKLDYLEKLGIDVIWLTPVHPSPWYDAGYDVADYDNIHPAFGTLADFDRLLYEAHRRGMKLLIDMVINHTSEEHPWFKASRADKHHPQRDFYIWRPGRNGMEPNNWGSLFGGSAWDKEETTGEYFLHLFSKHQPDLNWKNNALKQEIFAMMHRWLQRGVDGFRLDVINLLMKPDNLPDAPRQKNEPQFYVVERKLYADNPGMHEFLHDMYQAVFQHYDMMTVGEVHYNTKEMCQHFVDPAREELNMVFQADLLFGPPTLTNIRQSIQEWYDVMHGRGWNTIALGNHDTPRQVSRLGDAVHYRQQSATLLATLLLTAPGTPFIYQGEELGMTNVSFSQITDYRDIEMMNRYKEKRAQGIAEQQVLAELRAVSRDNARTPMQWSPNMHAGFTTGTPWIGLSTNFPEINAEDQESEPRSVLNYYRKLITYRKAHPALMYGDYQVIWPTHPQIYAYYRITAEERLLIILNYSSAETSISLPSADASMTPVVFNYADVIPNQLRPWEAIIFK